MKHEVKQKWQFLSGYIVLDEGNLEQEADRDYIENAMNAEEGFKVEQAFSKNEEEARRRRTRVRVRPPSKSVAMVEGLARPRSPDAVSLGSARRLLPKVV